MEDYEKYSKFYFPDEYEESTDAFNRELTDEEALTPEEYYNKYKGKIVYYKGILEGFVAGYVEHYLIIGFNDERGCIKCFSPHVIYDKEYQTYRFAKLKNITPF